MLQSVESKPRLTRWSAKRKVVALRREVKEDILVVGEKKTGQLEFAFMETTGTTRKYEYAVLVTALEGEVRTQGLWQQMRSGDACW